MSATFVSFSIADEASRTLEIGTFSDDAVWANLSFRRRRFDEGVVGGVTTHRQLRASRS